MLIWLRICAPLINQGSCEHCLSLSLSFSDMLCLKVSKTQAGYVFGEKNKLLPASHFLCSHYFRPPMSPCQALIMCFHFMSGLRQSYTCWIGEFTFDCFIHNVCRTLDRSIVLKIPRQIQKHCNIKNKKLSGKDYFYLTRTTTTK